MFSISSETLSVCLLDPKVDFKRFGTRYCTGGYIFQIYDASGRALLSGPTFPESFNTFDGQGIPDSFSHAPLLLRESRLFLIPGIGECDLASNSVVRFSDWEIEIKNSSAVFAARETKGGYDFTIVRTIQVDGRTIISRTMIENEGSELVPISWYPHPFFPPREDLSMFSLVRDAYFDAPTGYFAIENGNVRRIKGIEQKKSFQPVLTPGEKFLYAKIHARNSEWLMTTDYYSHQSPIWANDRTFSIEPYYQDTAFAGHALSWSVSYKLI